MATAPPPRLLVAALLAAAGSVDAQIARRSDRGRTPPIRAEVNLVLVPVTVTDRHGAYVGGLTKDSFTVLEEKVAQPILSFASEEAPCSLGLVFDVSGSMKGKIAAAYQSAGELLRHGNLSDDAFLMTFADGPEMRQGFSDAFHQLADRLRLVKPGGRTALVDAVYLGLNRMRPARHSRRALILITDGIENHSRYSKPELLSYAREADVQVHSIGIYDPPATMKPIELAREREALRLLEDLAKATGGLHLVARNNEEGVRAATRIAEALRHQYLLGYQPPAAGDARWRRIQVKLDVPNTRVYARSGYYPPGQ